MSTESVIEEAIWQGSDRLYILFGGVLGQFGMSNFEFARSARILDYSHIFLRDPSRSWYQNGLPGIGGTVQEIADFLARRIDDIGATDVRFIGNCMGGFAALLFCSLVRQGRAIVFAPQSFLSPERCNFHEDHRVPHLLKNLWSTPSEAHIYDLQPWLKANRPELSAEIYVSTSDRHDLAHARELSGFKNIRINYFEEGGHALIRHLGTQGLLPAILNA